MTFSPALLLFDITMIIFVIGFATVIDIQIQRIYSLNPFESIIIL